MSDSIRYLVQRSGADEGPFTIAQINRMRQKGLVAPDTLCRREQETAYRRLDEYFPHLKVHQRADPEKMARLKEDIANDDISSLIKWSFGTGALFWLPLVGTYMAMTGFGCGLVLVFKHRQPIGILAVLLGAFGLWARFHRLWT